MIRLAGMAAAVTAAIALSGCSAIGGVINAVNGATADKPSVFELKVGDCFTEPTPDSDGLVGDLEFVKCSVEHDNEAFKDSSMSDAKFPGDDATFSAADDVCGPAFFDFIGTDNTYDGSLSYSYFVPTQDSWAKGDRAISCYAYDNNGKTTGTLKGAAQ